MLAKNGEEYALQSQDESGGEESAGEHSNDVACEQGRKIGRIDGGGKNQRRKTIGIEEKARNKERDRSDACPEESSIVNGQSRENKDVKQIGKEQVPLEDRDDSHGNEGIDDEEEMMIDLGPIWRTGRN